MDEAESTENIFFDRCDKCLFLAKPLEWHHMTIMVPQITCTRLFIQKHIHANNIKHKNHSSPLLVLCKEILWMTGAFPYQMAQGVFH